jgi:hypothetical protein
MIRCATVACFVATFACTAISGAVAGADAVARAGAAGGVSAGASTGASAGATAGATAGAAQKGRIVRTTDLRDLPTSGSTLIEVVPANTEIAVLERQGGWYRVALPSREGWVRLTAVRFATATPSSSGGLTASLGFLKSGRSAVQTGTVTTGVRGLSEADLASSVPDPEAVDALDALAAAPDDARQHARALGLKATEVPFIKAQPKDKDAKKDGKGQKGKQDKSEDDDEEGG